MERGEKLIKEVAKDACMRSDSIVIDNDDKVSTEENKEESCKVGEIAIGNKEACIGVVSSCVISLDILEGVDNSTSPRAGGMFGSWLFYPIGLNLNHSSCIITNAIVVCPMEYYSYLGRGCPVDPKDNVGSPRI